MKVVFVHHMITGLGEIFSSWLSIFYINNILRNKGFKTHLVIECSERCGYFSIDTLFDFFDREEIELAFNTLKLTEKYSVDYSLICHTSFQLNDPMYSLYSTETHLPEECKKYYNLKANTVYKEGLSLTFPPIVKKSITDTIDYPTDFTAHHIRLQDQKESIDKSIEVAKYVTPNLSNYDYIFSNCLNIKDYLQSNVELDLHLYSNAKVGNHPYTNMTGIDIDIKTQSLLQAYKEMIVLSNAKFIYMYSAWDIVSGFLIMSSIKQIPYKHFFIEGILE